jgi:hypothetical protein
MSSQTLKFLQSPNSVQSLADIINRLPRKILTIQNYCDLLAVALIEDVVEECSFASS